MNATTRDKNSKLVLTLLALALALGANAARADSSPRDRIADGVERGELTRYEAHRLYEQADALRAKRQEYLRDDYLSRGERHALRRDAERLDREITAQRSDGDVAPTYARMRGRINEEQRHQHARIAHGVRTGELTNREARELWEEQREIREQEREYRADGVLTPWERSVLNREMREANRNILDEASDTDRRW